MHLLLFLNMEILHGRMGPEGIIGQLGRKIPDDWVPFRQEKFGNFDNIFIAVCSFGCGWWEVGIGLNNSKVLNRLQTI